MADIRIKDLTTLESASLTGDVFVIDGTTGTRKLSAFSPTFGGNATVTGTLNGGGLFDFAVSANSTQVYTIQNTSTGASAATRFTLVGGSSSGSIQLYGSGHSTPNILQYASPDTHKWQCNGVERASLSSAGVLSLLATTASTTTSTGALVVGNGTSGGLGVGGAINAGGTLRVIGSSQIIRVRHDAATIDFTNTTQDAYVAATVIGNTLQLSGNNGNGILIGATGIATVQATTASTTTSSGALVVSGGVGVAGAIYAGGTQGIVNNVSGSNDALLSVKGASQEWQFRLIGSSGNLSIYNATSTTAAVLISPSTSNAIFAGNITTAAPAGGTAAAWKLGTVATVSPTSPNRTIEVDIGGTIYYLAAKTTNN